MADLNWMTTATALSPAALSVRAQTLSPTDSGARLLWPTLFPRDDVDSVELDDIVTLDKRFVADRREWNARGRLVPLEIPERRKIRIVPVEAYAKIDELEMQRLSERATGNAAILQELIGARIPARIDTLAMANFRRLEVDAFYVWLNGSIIQRNPATGETFTASMGFDTDQYPTAGTAWNDAGTNGYTELKAFLTNAQDAIGPVEAVMMRLSTFNAIIADAPNLDNSVTMTRNRLNERLSDDMGFAVRVIVNEESVDVFDDGGTAVTRTKLFTTQKVAAIPVGQRIGRTAFAPVARAYDLVAQVGSGGIDVRGQTAYYEASNGGRELTLEVQVNALPIPDASKVYVASAGV